MVALTAATVIESVTGAGRGAIFSIPAAIIVAYVASGPGRIRLPLALVARGVTVALVLGPQEGREPFDVRFVLVAALLTTVGYAVAAAVWRRVERRGAPVRAVLLAAMLGTITPLAVTSGLLLLDAVSGAPLLEMRWDGAMRFALGEVSGLAAGVPLAAALAWGRERRTDTPRQLIQPVTVVLLSAAAGVLGTTLQIGGERPMLLAILPLLVATWRFGPVTAGSANLATALGMAAGLASSSADTTTVVLAQLAFVALAIGASVAVVLVHVASREAQPVAPEQVAGIETPGLDDYPAYVATLLRAVRVLMIPFIVGSSLLGLTLDQPPGVVPRWLPAGLLVGMLVAANVASHVWDVTSGYDRARQRRATWMDAGGVVFGLSGALAGVPAAAAPVTLAALGAMVSLRLPRAAALQVTGAAVALHLALRAWGPRLDPGLGRPDASDVLAAVVFPALIVVVVGAAVTRLEMVRDRLLSVTQQMGEMHAELTSSNRRLTEASVGQRMARAELLGTVDRLEHTNAELELVRDQLEGFASVVAHDLRGPLSTAHALAETALDPRLPTDTANAFVARIAPNLERANLLLSRLYDHARSTTRSLSMSPADLNVVLRGVLDAASVAIEDGEATVVLRRMLPRIECDPVLIAQVLSNLIANALQHGGLGVLIEVDASWGDDGLTVTVADDGPGFTEVEGDTLFVAGTRGTRHSGDGLGLGLATCRTVIERHGGRIRAHHSDLGGAAISFTLPMPTTGARTVLVVDDDADTRLLYRTKFEALNGRITVVEAATLAAARQHLAGDVVFDLALIDLRLPDGLGTEIVLLLGGMGVPMHLVSAHVDEVGGDDVRATVRITDKAQLMLTALGGLDALVGAAIGAVDDLTDESPPAPVAS